MQEQRKPVAKTTLTYMPRRYDKLISSLASIRVVSGHMRLLPALSRSPAAHLLVADFVCLVQVSHTHTHTQTTAASCSKKQLNQNSEVCSSVRATSVPSHTSSFDPLIITLISLKVCSSPSSFYALSTFL